MNVMAVLPSAEGWNTMSIIRQQLELELGEDFQERWKITTRYVKGLIGKPWWRDTGALVKSEGPLSNMVEQCLAFEVSEDDINKGRKAYTSTLTPFYGRRVSDANAVGDVMASEEGSISWTTMGSYIDDPFFEFVSVDEEQSSVLDDVMSDKDKDFILAQERMGRVELAEFLGKTPEQVSNRRDTVRRTTKKRLASL